MCPVSFFFLETYYILISSPILTLTATEAAEFRMLPLPRSRIVCVSRGIRKENEKIDTRRILIQNYTN